MDVDDPLQFQIFWVENGTKRWARSVMTTFRRRGQQPQGIGHPPHRFPHALLCAPHLLAVRDGGSGRRSGRCGPRSEIPLRSCWSHARASGHKSVPG
jgi:hypothetical protein